MKVWELKEMLAGRDDTMDISVHLSIGMENELDFPDLIIKRDLIGRCRLIIELPGSTEMFEEVRRYAINNRACQDCRELSYKAAGAEARVAELEEEVKLNDERVLAKYGKKP